MDSVKNFVVGFGLSLVNYLFGGWSDFLGYLVFFMAVDYFTGVMASFKLGKISSKVGFWGFLKKISMLIVVAIGYKLNLILGTDIIMNGVIFGYMANELWSIIENLGKINVLIPDSIKKGIEVLNQKGEKE